MNPIISAEFVNKNTNAGPHVDSVTVTLDEDSIKDRALTELDDAGVINSKSDRSTFSIQYRTSEGERLGMATFSIIEDICYFSWIWVEEPLRGDGFGSKLLEQSLSVIDRYDVRSIYVLPKSDEALSIFNSAGFSKSDNADGFYVKKTQ